MQNRPITKNDMTPIRQRIGATASLIAGGAHANTRTNALGGINIPYIDLSAKNGMEFYFQSIDYAGDFFVFLKQSFQEVTLEGCHVTKTLGKGRSLSFDAKVTLKNHQDIINFIEYTCQYANHEGWYIASKELYTEANVAEKEKIELKQIYHSIVEDKSTDLLKLTAEFHKFRADEKSLACINLFIATMNKFLSNPSYPSYPMLRNACLSYQGESSVTNAFSPSIDVIDKDYIQCAVDLKRQFPGKNVAIHNMANAFTPGGAVIRGPGSAEELMCREWSDLYLQLLIHHVPDYQHHPLYHFVVTHLNPIANNELDAYVRHAIFAEEYAKLLKSNKYQIGELAVHYTPNVLFLVNKKEDVAPHNVVPINVISSAAYDLRFFPPSETDRLKFGIFSIDNQLFKDKTKNKIRVLFDSAISNGVDILVLSAFGCGAFENDPAIVSQGFKDVLQEEKYKKFAESAMIIFSIYKSEANLNAFKKIFASEPTPESSVGKKME